MATSEWGNYRFFKTLISLLSSIKIDRNKTHKTERTVRIFSRSCQAIYSKMVSKATSLLLIFLMVLTGVTEVQNNPLQSITKVNTDEIISEYNLAISDIINEDRYCGLI